MVVMVLTDASIPPKCLTQLNRLTDGASGITNALLVAWCAQALRCIAKTDIPRYLPLLLYYSNAWLRRFIGGSPPLACKRVEM